MNPRLLVACVAALTQQGCMMGMMGGMGGRMSTDAAGAASVRSPGSPHVIIRTMQDDLEVSAEFPVFGPEDPLEYRVTLRRRDGSPVTAEASVAMSSAPEDPAGSHRMGSGPSQWTPTREGDGTLLFRPSLPRGASYRLVVTLTRLDGRVMEPPVTIAHVVRLEAPGTHGSAGRPTREGPIVTPLILVGAGAMALMMILVGR